MEEQNKNQVQNLPIPSSNNLQVPSVNNDDAQSQSQVSHHNRKKKEPERIKTTLSEAQTKYTGYVLNDEKDGHGIEIHTQNQTEYHGFWKANKYDGEGIYFQKLTNCFYKGFWKEGQKVAGIEIFPNGDQYEGEYDQGKYHGQGSLHNKSMGYKYKGEFKNGFRYGKGTEYYKSGSYYEGYFKDSQKHGKGKLQFPDKSYYEGDFLKGEPSGFGIWVSQDFERSKSIMPDLKRMKQLEQERKIEEEKNNLIQEDEEDDDNSFLNIKVNPRDEDEEPEEYYYEGEFVEGYKHGIGRYYFPNGSYFYCQWEFDKKVGDVLYYNAKNHKWKIFKYRNPNDVADHYLSPDDTKIVRNVEIVIREQQGFPPDNLDAYKAKIDECGIMGDQFEDPDLEPLETSLNANILDYIAKDLPSIEFLRITEMDNSSRESLDLFVKPIQPCQFIYNKYCDQQLITILEALSRYPNLFFKVFTIKFELGTVCYITLKFYMDGKWKEIVIDDYIPCMKINKECVFANTINNEIGWIVLQKAFAKFYGGYYYQFSPDYPIKAKEYLQMLTGLPCKTIQWHNIVVENQTGHGQESEQFKDVYNKIWKNLNSQKNPEKVNIAYPREDTVKRFQLRNNTSYVICGFTRIEEESEDGEYNYVLLQTVNPENKLIQSDTMKIDKEVDEHSQVKQMYVDANAKRSSDKHQLMSLKQFVIYFGEIHILIGTGQPVQNCKRIKSKITDFINTDHRFFVKFGINLPTKVLINVEQHRSSEEDSHFPVRLILANEKDSYANTKKQFMSMKVLDAMKRGVEEQKKIQSASQSQLETPKKQQKGGINQQSNNPEIKAENSEDKKGEIIKSKNLPYLYCFGKGQKQCENIFKSITLKAGIYILLVQVEGPDIKEADKKSKPVSIDFTISLFSETLIHIEPFIEPENFLRNLYEQCIQTAEHKYSKGKKIEHFSRSDLQDREKGCHDLIITQYFLKREGTYLQYLQNQSYDKSSKSWRQKLYFRTENMKILDQNDPHKVDLYLLPGNETLIIIQQQGAKTYNLEGGEGICIIDKIGKNKQSDDEDSGYDDDEDDGQEITMKKFTEKIHSRKVKQQQQQQTLNEIIEEA